MKVLTAFFITTILAILSCGPAKKTAEVSSVPEAVNPSSIMEKPVIDKAKQAFSMAMLKGTLGLRPEGNVILSPYSAGVAFTMLADGSIGKTKEAIINALSCSSYYGDVPYTDSLNIVKTANSLWLNGGLVVKGEYAENLKNNYNAQIYAKDNGDPFTVEAVNQWCADHTENLIDKILEYLDPETRMILMNALYFKAPWEVAFDANATYKEVFHGEKEDKEVDFMHKTSDVYGYAYNDGCTYVALPYKGDRYAMLIAMPDDITKIGNSLGADSFLNALGYLRPGREVCLSLPKFKLEFEMVLNDLLSLLGAGIIFSPAADFSGITDEKLSVSQAIQKCVLEVNEEGSEAAAVTAIVFTRTSVNVDRVYVKINKPFLFAIYDTKDKSILFEGKIAEL